MTCGKNELGKIVDRTIREHKAHLVLIFNVYDPLFRFLNKLVLPGRHRHIIDGDGYRAASGVFISCGLDIIQHFAGRSKAVWKSSTQFI